MTDDREDMVLVRMPRACAEAAQRDQLCYRCGAGNCYRNTKVVDVPECVKRLCMAHARGERPSLSTHSACVEWLATGGLTGDES